MGEEPGAREGETSVCEQAWEASHAQGESTARPCVVARRVKHKGRLVGKLGAAAFSQSINPSITQPLNRRPDLHAGLQSVNQPFNYNPTLESPP